VIWRPLSPLMDILRRYMLVRKMIRVKLFMREGWN